MPFSGSLDSILRFPVFVNSALGVVTLGYLTSEVPPSREPGQLWGYTWLTCAQEAVYVVHGELASTPTRHTSPASVRHGAAAGPSMPIHDPVALEQLRQTASARRHHPSSSSFISNNSSSNNSRVSLSNIVLHEVVPQLSSSSIAKSPLHGGGAGGAGFTDGNGGIGTGFRPSEGGGGTAQFGNKPNNNNTRRRSTLVHSTSRWLSLLQPTKMHEKLSGSDVGGADYLSRSDETHVGFDSDELLFTGPSPLHFTGPSPLHNHQLLNNHETPEQKMSSVAAVARRRLPHPRYPSIVGLHHNFRLRPVAAAV